jgi:hypothetical protein
MVVNHSYDHPGSLAYVCMDWAHVTELLDAARSIGLDLINVCVWTKPNAGMGSLYRSQHELVFVFKLGSGRHDNNVQLGAYGQELCRLCLRIRRPREGSLACHRPSQL